MLSLILSFVGGTATLICLLTTWPGHPIWSLFAGLAVFLGIIICINLLLKKKLEAAFTSVQNCIQERQAQIMRKARARGANTSNKFREELEREQDDSIREAIKLLNNVKPFEKWNFMVRRQADTLRAQFYFMLKEYEKADKYFNHALLLDPLLMAMQMTRHYKNGNKKQLEKCYKKGIRRFKDEKGVIIFALYSWILVHENRLDDAIQVLVTAKKTKNEILLQNWDNLVNGHIKRFSNAGLGDQWYTLRLEEPKIQRIREQPARGGGFWRNMR